MVYYETFPYNIKFDYDNGLDRKFKKYVTADTEEEFNKGINMIIGKLFRNEVVSSQNLRRVTATPETDGDAEKLTFGEVQYSLNQIKEKFKDFFS